MQIRLLPKQRRHVYRLFEDSCTHAADARTQIRAPRQENRATDLQKLGKQSLGVVLRYLRNARRLILKNTQPARA